MDGLTGQVLRCVLDASVDGGHFKCCGGSDPRQQRARDQVEGIADVWRMSEFSVLKTIDTHQNSRESIHQCPSGCDIVIGFKLHTDSVLYQDNRQLTPDMIASQ